MQLEGSAVVKKGNNRLTIIPGTTPTLLLKVGLRTPQPGDSSRALFIPDPLRSPTNRWAQVTFSPSPKRPRFWQNCPVLCNTLNHLKQSRETQTNPCDWYFWQGGLRLKGGGRGQRLTSHQRPGHIRHTSPPLVHRIRMPGADMWKLQRPNPPPRAGAEWVQQGKDL